MRITKTIPISKSAQSELHVYLRESGIKIKKLSETLEIPEQIIYNISSGRCKRISKENEEKLNNHYKQFYKK